ncbi:MAG: AAA family ATPase [Armatimonadetes bacterium]|nr:AAA family ATPase [Armatimonadota bacterium]
MPDDDSPGWAAYTRQVLGYAPDVVFTSEDYGDAYAHHLGCRHVLVDRERVQVPISGTALRADPLAHREFLEPCVRAYFVKRVALVGAESSGTTTMARALATHYRDIWVPEYGRAYSEEKMRRPEASAWRPEEFVHIARRQCEMEDMAARETDRVLLCDTPAFATSLWHERYLGTLSPEVEAIAAPYHYDLYLLTGVDIPFVQDGTRDGEHIRHRMHRRFVEWLTAHHRPFTLLSGPHEERLRAATRRVDALLV